jgi:hypothetical protein
LAVGGLVPDVKLRFAEEWEEVNEDDEMEADEEMVEDAPQTNGTSSHNGTKETNDYLQALIPTLTAPHTSHVVILRTAIPAVTASSDDIGTRRIAHRRA